VWESNVDRVLITRNLLILLRDLRDVRDVAEGLCTIPYKNQSQEISGKSAGTALRRWRIQVGYTTTALDRLIVAAAATGVPARVGEGALLSALDVVDSKAVTANARLFIAGHHAKCYQSATPRS
jgi:hypothetical protein